MGRAGSNTSSRGWTQCMASADRACTQTGHQSACGRCVQKCRSLSSLVAGPPTDGKLTATGHGDGSLSKRAGSLNVPPARTNGKLSSQRLEIRVLLQKNRLIALVHQLCHRQNDFTDLIQFERALDGQSVLNTRNATWFFRTVEDCGFMRQ